MGRKEKDAERLERKQQKLEASPISAKYPDVSSVVISMNYYQRNSTLVFMQRTVNFFPGSPAYFLMECVKHDCMGGGFDLDPVVTGMMKDHLESGKGELVCPGNNASGHARVDYTISIQYTK